MTPQQPRRPPKALSYHLSYHILSLLCGLLLLSTPSLFAQHTPFHTFRELRLGTAICQATDSTLLINTGAMDRVYRITPDGLLTTRLTASGNDLANRGSSNSDLPNGDLSNSRPADWGPVFTGPAQLTSLSAKIDDDSGFTSPHITVTADFTYPAVGVDLRYAVWVYPGSGIRTQLALKRHAQTTAREPLLTDSVTGSPPSNDPDLKDLAVEYIPAPTEKAAITAFGYYNDTQHRDTDTTPILREAPVSPGVSVDWASGLLVRHGTGEKTGGLIVVKESHKCVNQPGVLTGGFTIGADGITVTGAGLSGRDLDTGGYKACWASWIVPYLGDSTDALLALKQFDRTRYPVRVSDRYIMANTWGNSDTTPKGQGQYAARETDVLREITSQASLGIDVQQIDDGWQGRDYSQWRPAAGATMLSTVKGVSGKPYSIYPDGWSKVKAYAAKKNVKLGLWAAWNIPEADLKWNYDQGGFQYVKLDFSVLDTREKLDKFMAKVRSFVLYTRNTVRINWDVTENTPRVGYFYAREFGNVWLENRKPQMPVNVLYQPRLVLRDEWELAKYTNLNQFQVAITNVDAVNRSLSNAYLYSNPYCTAIALLSSPMFFSLTQFYSAKDRAKIHHLLSAYKHDRDSIYKGYTFPIGDRPDDSFWTGFQDVVPGSATGWLLLFRELRNTHPTQAIRLPFIRDCSVELTDLLTGKTTNLFVDKAGFAIFTIARPADFRFYRYKIRPARHR